MARFNLTAGKTVAELKNEFKAAFGSTLKVYNKNVEADLSSTLKEVGLESEIDWAVGKDLEVGAFIESMKEFGLKVKVFTQDEWVSVLPELTLEASGLIKKNATIADQKNMLEEQQKNNEDDELDLDSVCCEMNLLPQMHMHDIVDGWRILFMDGNLDPVSESDLKKYKKEMEKAIKQLQLNEGSVQYPETFTLDIYHDMLIADDGFPAGGETITEDVESICRVALSIAKKHEINVLAHIRLNAVSGGRNIDMFECAALINNYDVCFELSAYPDYEEDDCFTDDAGNSLDYDTIVEFLNDNFSDECYDSPWEKDEDGEITEAGSELQDKFYNVIGKVTFPCYYED